MKLALRIDVESLRGAREALPRLLEWLRAREARASFFFNVGPDNTGRALLRADLRRAGTTLSSRERFGLAALAYGTVLPAPEVGRRCREALRSVTAEGHEAGVLAWDRLRWESCIENADGAWTESVMRRARDRFEALMDAPPKAHAAPGWRMNGHAFRLTQRLGFDYASDTRGTGPFIPVWRGEVIACPQVPTTLPTLDEAAPGTPDAEAAFERLRAAALEAPPWGHVFTLHAELILTRLGVAAERLLDAWKADGHELVTLSEYAQAFEARALPRHEIATGRIPGRSWPVALQGPEFLA